MKRYIIVGLALILALAVGFGAGRIAAAGTPGSKDDPLITLDYLNEQFAPALAAEIDAKIRAAVDELSKKIGSGSSANTNDTGGFALVYLHAGQTLTATSGAEALLRTGSAFVSSGVLSDTSGGSDISVGSLYLLANHMYIMPPSSSLTAIDSSVSILVRGAYRIA